VLAACGEDQSPTAPTPPAGPSGPAYSHTPGHKVVNSLADPGNGVCNATQCTLREAINDPQSTEISFAPGLSGTITLARPGAGGGTLVIEKRLTITGPSTGIVIRRRSTDPDFRIFRIPEAGNVTLTNLTIQNGKRTDRDGGGILNFGTLRLTNSTVAGSSASFGGGIANEGTGTLILTNSTVAGNSATGIFSGGGIGNIAMLTLTRTTVARNSGGGISNLFRGTLALTRSTVARNTGVGVSSHGGLAVRTVATLTNARIVGNSAGGIASSNGSVTLRNSTVAGNSAFRGGGLANLTGGRVTITNSTIAGNSATQQGGGIFNEGGFRPAFVRLTNSTVSGNSARSGGGIVTVTEAFAGAAGVGLRNSTVVDNSATQKGGGILVSGGASLGLTNSLVAKNGAPAGPDVSRETQSEVGAFFSLIGDGTGSGITNTNGNQVGNVPPNTSPIDPKLGSLADNGGPTRTHALLLGSPAIDAASTPACPPTDQRGVLRPQGAACDIGSFERK
jgi:CSLREA domain-containing protein